MSARIQGTKIAFSKAVQDDIATASLVADMWSFTKTNSSLMNAPLGIENDAREYGKGHEFATALFVAGWAVTVPIEKWASSQFLAWVWGLVLGNSAKTGSVSPWTYTITPIAAGSGLELPYASYVEQIPGTDDDRMAVGCSAEEVQMFISSGPGRQNCRIQASLVGSGLLTEPSGITIPAAQSETILPAGLATITINGTSYSATSNSPIESLQLGWKNNLRPRFNPGSGFRTAGDPTSGQIASAIEIGDRAANLSFTVRLSSGSDEYSKLLALTTGTAVISLPLSANHAFTATFQKVAYTVVAREDTNGIATVKVTTEPMYHSSNGILTVVVKTTVDGINEAA